MRTLEALLELSLPVELSNWLTTTALGLVCLGAIGSLLTWFILQLGKYTLKPVLAWAIRGTCPSRRTKGTTDWLLDLIPKG
jgi:hypothetical protein